MKIGVMSDTHDNLSNLISALGTFRRLGIDTVIHCGDLTSLEMVSHFEGFRVIYIIGNMDVTNGAIVKRFKKLNEENFAGVVFKGKVGGVQIAATHSHIKGMVASLVRQNHYQWIFHGHTHEKRDEMIRGTRIVNPGALGGMGREPRSFCVVDLDTENIKFLKPGIS
ncbi:MAG: YfcE family phosphodiesterase [Chloroflexota bacterium]|nr:YfcE family phosphodiesterase [Chloroflexota bacterium]